MTADPTTPAQAVAALIDEWLNSPECQTMPLAERIVVLLAAAVPPCPVHGAEGGRLCATCSPWVPPLPVLEDQGPCPCGSGAIFAGVPPLPAEDGDRWCGFRTCIWSTPCHVHAAPLPAEDAATSFSVPFFALYADEDKALEALTKMTCPAPCVGYVNETGWHSECEKRARAALLLLRGPFSGASAGSPAPTAAACAHTDTWLAREICSCAAAHRYCSDCGVQVEPCNGAPSSTPTAARDSMCGKSRGGLRCTCRAEWNRS